MTNTDRRIAITAERLARQEGYDLGWDAGYRAGLAAGHLGLTRPIRPAYSEYCPECWSHRPTDERVRAGMKCGSCAGYAS